ncbi:MAG TPA: hypothetical protein VFF28_03455 [Candidatus Nanoarchaeia archaeon]|nr:hypothetical protein [Candidatus Nanoarchaeia archaeon]
MKPNEGRLQTGEHILARVVQNRVPDAKVAISRFDKEDEGSVDIISSTDLRQLQNLEPAVNAIIKAGFRVDAREFAREELTEFDLSRVPAELNKIRIVEIVGFDKRPCKDPHVDNTAKVERFILKKIERAGKDRYKFTFTVTAG